MAKLFTVETDGGKCGCCNWGVTRLYLLADSQEDADELYEFYREDDGSGLCGDCMADMLVEGGYEIVSPDAKAVVP
jgi:hypothetical protein